MTAKSEYAWHQAWNASYDWLVPPVLGAMKEAAVAPDDTVLDAGCGGGYVLHCLGRNGYRDVWGFDASESGIRVAHQEFPELSGRVALHDAYEQQLPDGFPRSGYRAVLSIEVIEHLYSPRTYLRNVVSWLAPGGHLILTTPYHGYLKNLAMALLNRFDRHVDSLEEGSHIKFFSRYSLERALRDAGLVPQRFSGCGRVPYLWKSMVVVARKP